MSDRVKLIQKIAQDIPVRPGGPRGSVVTPVSMPVPTKTDPGTTAPVASAGSVVVKAMQQELINLAREVRSQIKLEDLAHKPGETADVRKQQEAAGRGSFGDFITKNYLRTSDVPGVEFDPDPTKQQMEQKKPSDPTRLSVVMDTMERIGNPKGGEFAADGSWGPRTNAALRNVYSFAFALMRLASDFQLPVSYKSESLSALKELIPVEHTDFSPEQKEEAAGDIIKHVKGIERMYQEIKAGILEKPAYRAFIEADKPFITYQKKGPTLTQQQLASLHQTFANGFPIKYKTESKSISINDLLSMGALKAWQQQNAPEMPLPNILVQIKNQLGTQPAQ